MAKTMKELAIFTEIADLEQGFDEVGDVVSGNAFSLFISFWLQAHPFHKLPLGRVYCGQLFPWIKIMRR